MVQSNIDRIIQIYHVQVKRFLHYKELVDTFGSVFDELTYYTILAAIPKQWKMLLKSMQLTQEIDLESSLERYGRIPSPSKYMYWKLVEKNLTPSSNVALKVIWENELKITLEDQTWKHLFSEFRKIVKPAKLQYMQYKILTRSLTTNVKRNKWNPLISQKCAFCHHRDVTIEHLLWDCEIITTFREKLYRILKYLNNKDINITKQSFMLNNYEGDHKNIVNLFSIVLKQYIYATKCKEEKLSCQAFMSKLSEWYQIERLSINEDFSIKKYVLFKKKWIGLFDT